MIWVPVFIGGVSGALAGKQKNMDLFGMFVLAVLTGVGGGTLRSLLIGDLPLFVFEDPIYLAVAVMATALARIGEPLWSRVKRVVSTVDALSLGIFVSLGIRVGQQHGMEWWACICLGVITATFGGVLRDIARAEVPLIFRREIYATACIAGGLALYGLDALGVSETWGALIITVIVAAIRLTAIRYALNQSSV